MGNSIAVITARGGSKRIPKKNIKEFCGKPIIAYSIETALNSGLFDEVMVSTDSFEIADIAKKYGAKVPFMRSERTAGDFATTEDVLLEVIDNYEKFGRSFDYICCIYPTAPFVSEEKLQRAMCLMEEKRPSQVIPVVRFSYPPQRGFIVNDEGYIGYKYPEYITTRSQDLEPMFHDAGQFYVYDVKALVDNDGIIEDGLLPMELSELDVQDIDNETDWKLAELKYKFMRENFK